jgi:phage/plasmid-like protein (TIGR03299 family)
MAHQLLENDTMISVKKAPWHNLGTILQAAPTTAEAIKLAGLDWEVGLEKIKLADDSLQGKITHKAVVRKDTGAVLGVVGPTWRPLQNRDAFAFFDSFIEAGQVEIETAGSLRNNKTVWILAKIAGLAGEAVKDDTIERYVLLSHGHDGTMAIRTGFTDVRVVCQNTLSASFNSEASKLIRIRHNSRIQQNLETVKQCMDLANSEFRANMDLLKKIANKDINQEDVKKFVRAVWFETTVLDGAEANIRSINNYNQRVQDMFRLIETGRGSDIPGVKGTLYGLYNAATEYLTHEASNSEETRLNSLWFGENARLNEKVLRVSLEMAGVV